MVREKDGIICKLRGESVSWKEENSCMIDGLKVQDATWHTRFRELESMLANCRIGLEGSKKTIFTLEEMNKQKDIQIHELVERMRIIQGAPVSQPSASEIIVLRERVREVSQR
jgi:hypothetical protein